MASKLTRLTHKIAIQLHLVAESCYHLQFSLQATSPETFSYTLVYTHRSGNTILVFQRSIAKIADVKRLGSRLLKF